MFEIWKNLASRTGKPFAFRVMDKLEVIFRMQEALNQRIGVEMDGFSDEEKG